MVSHLNYCGCFQGFEIPEYRGGLGTRVSHKGCYKTWFDLCTNDEVVGVALVIIIIVVKGLLLLLSVQLTVRFPRCRVSSI